MTLTLDSKQNNEEGEVEMTRDQVPSHRRRRVDVLTAHRSLCHQRLHYLVIASYPRLRKINHT
jgi:hypothetical protein